MNSIINKKLALATALASGMLVTGNVHAITCNLTLSSDDLSHITGGFTTGNIPNGNTYATVTINESGGLINFSMPGQNQEMFKNNNQFFTNKTYQGDT